MTKSAWGAAAFAAAALLAGTAQAATSPVFETNYGTAIVGGDDNTASGVLPFAFTLFGTSYNQFNASTNGFVTLGGTNGSGCCNGDVGQLLAGEARIAPQWFDIVGTVYLNTEVADRAVFTFTGGEYGHGGSYAAQAQLFADGSIIFGYSGDSIPGIHTTLTGISAGHGAADPGETELTGGPFSTGGALAVYDVAAGGTFDLNGQNVFFNPDGRGGYVVNGEAVGGVPEPATWAMMISGFFGAGVVLRSRRKGVLAA
ncbi:MAG: PEPxxWA-CTERM sorting domain-containing protein [Pseudomonadota bacterium]|jgi:hypothetical protein